MGFWSCRLKVRRLDRRLFRRAERRFNSDSVKERRRSAEVVLSIEKKRSPCIPFSSLRLCVDQKLQERYSVSVR